MGIAERKQRQKEEVRESILRAAWALVQQEGWASLSIRKIAEAIEYSVPVIYSHFENKEAILLEFLQEGFRLLNEDLGTAQQQAATPAGQLEAMAQAYWNFAFRNKEYYQVMYGLGMPSCETVKQAPQLGKFAHLVQSTIKQIIPEGQTADTVSFLKFHTFWSMLHGLVSINLVNNTACPDELHQRVLDDSIQGFIKNLSD